MSSSRSVAFGCNAALRSGRRFRNSVGHARDVVEGVVSPSSSSPRLLSTSTSTSARRGGFCWKWPGALASHRSLGSFFHHPYRQQFSSIGEAKSNDEVPSDSSPWRVAIVGSGPSGCYTAKYLMMGASSKLPPSRSSLSIDVIERLPTPYGLVRNGVAPDHPEVKNVQNDFDVLFEENESNNNNHEIRFYGNVTVGDSNRDSNSDSNSDNENTSDVALDELRALYDVVILTYGCESDRELDLPVDVLGEDGSVQEQTETRASDLKGILSAREFVNWYNGHPDYDWVTEEVKDALWKNKTASEQEESEGIVTQNIVVVGHGNVALDCARILAKSRDTLDPTDLTTRAIDVLRPPNNNSDNNNNEVQRSVSIVGRRGHVQAAFTIKEARELTKLVETDNAELVLRNDELEMGGGTEASKEELKARPRARIHKLLEGHAKQSGGSSSSSSNITTQVHLRFLTNPVRFEATPYNDGGNQEQLRLSSVVCERTELEGETPGAQNARGTGSTETIHTNLCLVSIGYKGLPIDSSTKASFDTGKGILKNDHGRVLVPEDGGNGNSSSDDTNNLAPLYVSGWLKRGPSGIIGTNIGDAKDTVVSILKDLGSGVITKPSLPSSSSSSSSSSSLSPLESLLQERKIRFVEWDSYRRIEQCESSNSENENIVGHQKRHPDQPREKIVDRETLLRAAEADR